MVRDTVKGEVVRMADEQNNPSEKPFDFLQHKDQYGIIGDYVLSYIQRAMVNSFGLREVWLPEMANHPGVNYDGPKVNIFMSEEFQNPDKEKNSQKRALVLIPGSGAVRAGQWARSVCTNDSLTNGSMLRFCQVA